LNPAITLKSDPATLGTASHRANWRNCPDDQPGFFSLLLLKTDTRSWEVGDSGCFRIMAHCEMPERAINELGLRDRQRVVLRKSNRTSSTKEWSNPITFIIINISEAYEDQAWDPTLGTHLKDLWEMSSATNVSSSLGGKDA
jgi:hypothetical protein